MESGNAIEQREGGKRCFPFPFPFPFPKKSRRTEKTVKVLNNGSCCSW